MAVNLVLQGLTIGGDGDDLPGDELAAAGRFYPGKSCGFQGVLLHDSSEF